MRNGPESAGGQAVATAGAIWEPRAAARRLSAAMLSDNQTQTLAGALQLATTLRNLNLAALSLALTVLALYQLASAATDSDNLPSAREQAVRAVVADCMATMIIDPMVAGYMKRAAEVGKPFATEAEARADMTGNVKWTNVMEPAIREACECYMKDKLDGIKRARTESEILKIVSDAAQQPKDVVPKEPFERCFKPIQQKMEKK